MSDSTQLEQKVCQLQGHEDLHFSAWRALYLPEEELLVLSDLHLGKSGHFQQQGAPVPANHHVDDLRQLNEAIAHFKPNQVLINGDLFHAGITRDVPLLSKQLGLMQEAGIKSILVRGNHDAHSDAWYRQLGFDEVKVCLMAGRYGFVHRPEDEALLEAYDQADTYIFGHVHTGVKLNGKGRQRLRMPAFALDEGHSIRRVYLPAFGRLTGLKMMELQKKRSFVLIADGKVFGLNGS